MVGCGSKIKFQKHMCFKEIGLRAQNVITILSSIVNIIEGGGEGEAIEHETLITNKILIRACKPHNRTL